MPANDRDVYTHFGARTDDPPEVVALAYAGYAKAKYDWVAHMEAQTRKLPSAQEVDRWIAELPDSRLDELREAAIDFFDLAARAYMAPDIESAVAAARDGAIIHEMQASVSIVQAATSFRSTFFPNLLIGIVASFAFSLIIFGASLIFIHDPSPFALYRSMQPGALPASIDGGSVTLGTSMRPTSPASPSVQGLPTSGIKTTN